MSERGFITSPDYTMLGMWGVIDKDGIYVSAQAGIDEFDDITPFEVAVHAAKRLKRRFKKKQEKNVKQVDNFAPEEPGFIWMTAGPGVEEEIIRGIKVVYGDEIPIVGGSSADNNVKGEWFQISNMDGNVTGPNGFAIVACHASVFTEAMFFSGN